MQKRIRQIAAGKFESDQPSLSISDEELFLTVTEGQEYYNAIIECSACIDPGLWSAVCPAVRLLIMAY